MLFGLPFVLMIVASSYGLSYMTQTRYDYNSSKVKSMSMEEELGMRKDRRKIDIREEYFVGGVTRRREERVRVLTEYLVVEAASERFRAGRLGAEENTATRGGGGAACTQVEIAAHGGPDG